MNRERIVLGWSGGKDSALALHRILAEGRYEVAGLLTTCTEGFRRISMHGVRCSLLSRQAQALNLSCLRVFIPQHCSNEDYEKLMRKACLKIKEFGITKIAFGDLFLEDIRAYRDRMLGQVGMTALYPVWGLPTQRLAREFIREGFRATLVCVDGQKLGPTFAGRSFDGSLLASLPPHVDPCGENGEFHTFVHAGPVFREPVACCPGRVVQRGQFYFADLLPVTRACLERRFGVPPSGGSPAPKPPEGGTPNSGAAGIDCAFQTRSKAGRKPKQHNQNHNP